MGEDEAMDVDVVLHHRLQGVERVVERRVGQRGEELLALLDIGHAAGVANRHADVLDGRFLGGVHLAQRLLRGAAELLNLLRVAIEHLQDRQRLPLGGQQLGHLQRRQHGHRRVEADVVLAAERLGIGQRAGRDELLQIRLAAVELFDQDRLQLARPACFASDRPARRTRRTTSAARPSSAKAGGEAQVLGQRRAQAGDQHSAADRFQKVAAGIERS